MQSQQTGTKWGNNGNTEQWMYATMIQAWEAQCMLSRGKGHS